MSAASLFTIKAQTQCPNTRVERSGCSRMWAVIPGSEKAMETKDGNGTKFPSCMNDRPKYHRPLRHIRRQQVLSSVKGEVTCKQVERRLTRWNRRVESNFPSEPLTMATE